MSVLGFPNLGNSCYFNSSIQCLIAMPFFRDFVSNSIDKGPLTLALATVMES